MDDQSVPERRTELRRAVIELRARGLNASAKWAAEQLTGLPSSSEDDEQPSTNSSSDDDENDTFLLAKTYFDLKVLLQFPNAIFTKQTCAVLFASAGISQSCACIED